MLGVELMRVVKRKDGVDEGPRQQDGEHSKDYIERIAFCAIQAGCGAASDFARWRTILSVSCLSF